jgi:hypothetical protein
MKHVAFEGGVMIIPDDFVEITAIEYAEAISGMTDGKLVTIDGGFKVIDPPAVDPVAVEAEGAV